MRILFTIIFFLTFSKPHAQTLGGNAAYNFLKFPYAASLTATGGVNISYSPPDVSFALNNPALLNASLHAQSGLNFTQLPAGVKGYQAAGAHYDAKHNTTFGAQIIFLNYGQIPATDAAGNSLGQFRATDYTVQVSMSKRYLERWHYGASLKWIASNYQLYRSAAIGADVGIQYLDSTNGISVAAVAKNMGAQVKSYAGAKEELPFDLEFGITKKLAAAPFAFSIAIQQAHRFNIFYNDPFFNETATVSTAPSFLNKAVQHVVVATHIFISKQLEATIGYNHLRRSELSLGTAGNGLAGFSAGVAARFEKLHITYAYSAYQRGVGYNQIGLNVLLNKIFGSSF